MTTMTLETSNIYADEKVSSKDLYLDAPTYKEFKKKMFIDKKLLRTLHGQKSCLLTVAVCYEFKVASQDFSNGYLRYLSSCQATSQPVILSSQPLYSVERVIPLSK